MDIVAADRDLQGERALLTMCLFGRLPRQAAHLPEGATGIGVCSISMLLTWVSHWRGAGAALYPEGVWLHRHDTQEGPLYELGPVLGPLCPLLTDDQIICLLC